MTLPKRIDDHDVASLEYLTSKWRDKPVVTAMLAAFTKPMNGIEAGVWDTLEGRTLDDAEGYWLTVLGLIVGEPRNGRDDTTLRAAVRVRVRVNRSEGRAVDVIDVMRLLDTAATYVEYYPMAFEVSFYDTALGAEFARLIKQTRAAGSYGCVLVSSSPKADVAHFCHAGDASPADNQKNESVWST